MKSTLTKNQKKVYGPKFYTEDGTDYRITATVRYDDQCGNGHNSFSITGGIKRKERGYWKDDSGGCIHDQIAKHFPELAPFIKWHLVSLDEPMYYVENTLYHALEHGPKKAWVYFTGPSDPLNLDGTKERLVSYEDAKVVKKAEGIEGYRIVWDEKSAKKAELDHARSTAVWPEVTDEELRSPDLKEKLIARLPTLMAAFKRDVEALGFTY